MYCVNCGKELKDNSLFCESCGAKIQCLNESDYGKKTKRDMGTLGIDASAYPEFSASSKEPVLVQPAPPFSVDADDGEKDGELKKRNKAPFIGIAIVITAIAITAIILFVIGSTGESDLPNATIDKTGEQVEAVGDNNKQDKTSIEGDMTSDNLSTAVSFTTVSSTSKLPTNGINTSSYDAINLIDDNISSCWCEGANGNGIGESVRFSSSQDQTVKGFMVWNGYQESDYLYDINARPKTIAVYADDDYIGDFELKDSGLCSQKIVLEEPIIAKSLTIKITDVYPGSKYEDCCISEIDFY